MFGTNVDLFDWSYFLLMGFLDLALIFTGPLSFRIVRATPFPLSRCSASRRMSSHSGIQFASSFHTYGRWKSGTQ